MQAIKFAQSKWLSLETKHKFKQLSDTELELYSLHLELTKNFNEHQLKEWFDFVEKVETTAKCEARKKRTTQSQKLHKLIGEKNKITGKCFEPEIISDFMINKSSVVFNEEELTLLNKGLKYTPKPTKTPLIDSAVDIETILKYKLPSIQEDIRSTANNIFDDTLKKKKVVTKTMLNLKLLRVYVRKTVST